jgi:hypothetical protein
LLKSWVEAGQPPDLFWHTTLRLQALILSGVTRRIERERLFAERQAWDTARLVGLAFNEPRKFPTFEKFRTPAGGVRAARQTMGWRQMKAMVLAHVVASGGEVIQK